MREQPPQPAWVLSFGLRHVTYAHLEVFAIGIDRADHHLVPQHELQVDFIRRHFDLPVPAGHAGEHQHTILSERLHALEHDRREARCLEDEVKGPTLLGASEDRQVCRRFVASAQSLDQVGVAVGFASEAKGCHLQTAQPQDKGSEQADSAGSHHCRSPWTPHPQAALNFIGLSDAFFHDGSRFEQYAHLFEPRGNLDDVLGVINIVFGQKPVAQVNATFKVSVIGSHVIGANLVINTGTGPAHGGYHVIVGVELGDVGADRFHSSEAFVADDEEVVPLWRGTVLCGVDLFVCAIHANAQDFNQHAAAVGDIVDRGLREFGKMYAIRLSRKYCDGFHGYLRGLGVRGWGLGIRGGSINSPQHTTPSPFFDAAAVSM